MNKLLILALFFKIKSIDKKMFDEFTTLFNEVNSATSFLNLRNIINFFDSFLDIELEYDIVQAIIEVISSDNAREILNDPILLALKYY